MNTTDVKTPRRVPWLRRPRVRALLASLLALLLVVIVASPIALAWFGARIRVGLRDRLGAMLGHPVDFDAIEVLPTGVELDGVTVHRVGDEPTDPLHVRRVHASIDWWHLVRTRTVSVSGLDLDGPTLRVARAPEAPVGTPSWTAQLVGLRSMGLEHVGVRHGSLDALGVSVRDADGVLAIDRGGFRAFGRAASLARGGLSFERVRAELEGTSDGFAVRSASATFAGGSVSMDGSAAPRLERGAFQVDARAVQLGRAMAALGLEASAPVALQGEATGHVTVEVRDGAPSKVEGEASIARAVVDRGTSRVALASASARGAWTPDGLRVAALELAGPGFDAHASGSVATVGALAFEVEGHASARREGLVALQRFFALRPDLDEHRVSAREARADFTLAGSLASPERATGTVRASLTGLRIQRPREAPLDFQHAEATVVRSPGSVTVRGASLELGGATVTGDATLSGRPYGALDRFDAHAHVALRDLAALDPFIPAEARAAIHRRVVPLSGAARVALDVHAQGSTLLRGALALDGRFVLEHMGVGAGEDQPPGLFVFPLAVARADGAFHYHGAAPHAGGATASVDEPHVQTPLGALTGRATLAADGRYHAELAGRGVEPAIFRGLIPGRVEGGRGEGTLVADGALTGGAPPALHGHFVVANARYTLPRELPITPGPLVVARFEGDWRVDGANVSLEHLALRSDLLTAGRGTIAVTPRGVRLVADLATSDAGRMASSFAPLRGVFRGGSGAGRLDLAIDPRGNASGSLSVQTRGGALVLPSVDASFATHPIDAGRVWLGFTPERLTFAGLSVRGSRGNLDAEGSVAANGTIAVRGHAWLTPNATAALLRPTHVGWLARLVGVRQVASDFTVSGDARGATLHASIVHTPIWHLAGPFIPRELQNVAHGRTRLFVGG